MTQYAAASDMEDVQEATGASDQEIARLWTDMLEWAEGHPDGRHFIEFGRYRNHGVSFWVVDGEIRNVQYGDRLG